MTNYDMARVARAAISVYQQTLGDPRSPDLDDAPESHRESLLAGVDVALSGATPAQQHAAWVSWHLDRGWKYGPVRDEEARTHPNLRPYEELPDEQQRVDKLFQGVVLAFAA